MEDIEESSSTTTSPRESWRFSRSVGNGTKNGVISKNETQRVNRLKVVIATVLILSALGVALSIYFYLKDEDLDKFSTSFAYDADKVLHSVGVSIEGNLGAMDAFATETISVAMATNQTFPFVTLPHFAMRATKTRSLSYGLYVSFQPVVSPQQRKRWEDYAAQHAGWVDINKRLQQTDIFYYGNVSFNHTNPLKIFNYSGPMPYTDDSDEFYVPKWQNYPTNDPAYNWDWLSGHLGFTTHHAINEHRAVLTQAYQLSDPNDTASVEEDKIIAENYKQFLKPGLDPTEPFSDFIYPISNNLDMLDTFGYDETNTSYSVVATVATTIYWRDIIRDVLAESSQGVVVVFENLCCPSFTYQINGRTTIYLGRGDLHETKYSSYNISKDLIDTLESNSSRYYGTTIDVDACPWRLNLYPSSQYEEQYTSNKPVVFAVCAILIFVFVSMVFLVYDIYVEKRQKNLLNTAVKTNNIVSSLFPSEIRDRMMQDNVSDDKLHKKNNDRFGLEQMNHPNPSHDHHTSKQMANLYPETTIFFADLAGFTSWSSSRSPSQVFVLLETLYGVFDSLARRRKVFKVETIGDCYVAACGLPDPDKNHAVIMARFAFDCLEQTAVVTIQLTTILGPETADLLLRIGLNSGPTTAGVLRGDKARFQLFGDTVNTASRMESTGMAGKIQVSQKTADLLKEAGKESWLLLRQDPVEAKGKGILTTYWLYHRTGSGSRISDNSKGSGSSSNEKTNFSSIKEFDKMEQFVQWNANVLKDQIKKILLLRMSLEDDGTIPTLAPIVEASMPIDELCDQIELPTLSHKIQIKEVNVDEMVEEQLVKLVRTIAHMYRKNPFHNFEHACHVVMSTVKLLERIQIQEESSIDGQKFLYLDPLAEFGILFSALIHDVDHFGQSNMQLVKDADTIAVHYHGKNVAEQHSIDLSWKLFMQEDFIDLRSCIFSSDNELKRFRQVVVNCVLATDIFDMDLKKIRESRWERAFSSSIVVGESATVDSMSRRATVVIEYLMQVSDISHTMQHWKVYQKWNYLLFQEMYCAYKLNHSDNDPSDSWYKGELWFFDHYVIPLAKKLHVCGVFGVSCDEFLDYAEANRSEWESKGREIVSNWAEQVKLLYG